VRILSMHWAARQRAARWLILAVICAAAAAPAWAQEIGTVAEVEGTVNLIHQGSSTPATIGIPINDGDEIQTGKPGRAVLVFQDDSALVITDESHIRIDEHEFRREASVIRSLIQLLQGRVRALVSEYYRTTNSTYEIHTPTAIAGVKGTEFVIAYDPVAEVTDVVGVSGTVQVQSLADRAARGVVLVTPHELTTVAKGQLPTPPRYIPDTRFRGYLDGLEFIAGGRPETLALRSVLTGATVPAPESAKTAEAPFIARGEPGDLPVRPRTPADVLGEPLPQQFYAPTSVGVNF
jgi:hypothetical protein